METRRFMAGMVLGLSSIALLSSLYFSPGGSASALTKGILWGFFGTLFLLLLGFLVFLWKRFRAKKQAAPDVQKTSRTPAGAPFWGAIFDAVTQPWTLFFWVLIVGSVLLYAPQLLRSPNWTWVPIAAGMLFVLFARAKSTSAEKNPSGGKDKKPHPTLQSLDVLTERIAILSTIAVIAYYGFFAPAGTWEKVAGKRGTSLIHAPSTMVIPEGIPLNPMFTSRKLEGWTATYVAANMHYRVEQSRWRGERLPLLGEPGRELTDIVDLTAGFGEGNERLDIRLTGSCCHKNDPKCPLASRHAFSKVCAGDWKDRGSQISGKFYLEVKEGGGGQRYFDAYLYDGNNIPEKSWLDMLRSGAPIPDIMLQFRPKIWNKESQ